MATVLSPVNANVTGRRQTRGRRQPTDFFGRSLNFYKPAPVHTIDDPEIEEIHPSQIVTSAKGKPPKKGRKSVVFTTPLVSNEQNEQPTGENVVQQTTNAQPPNVVQFVSHSQQSVTGKRKRTSSAAGQEVSDVKVPKTENIVNPSSSSVTQSTSQSPTCYKCKKVFDSAESLETHEKSCFKGQRYACHVCPHTNSQKSLLREHIKGVHEGDPFRCEVCPEETFIYKKSLQKHIKSVHTPVDATFKYTCTQCEAFASDDKTEFETHVARHLNVKKFKCNLCSQAFFSQSQLTGHLRNSCSASPAIASTPSVAVSSSSSSFECTVCGKILKAENSYREHFFAQHVENQERTWYYCEVCISRFLTPRGLQTHNCSPPEAQKKGVLVRH